MHIPRSARMALPIAYSYFKSNHGTETHYDEIKKNSKAVGRDKISAKSSRTGRISTTGRSGDLSLIVGPILAAAENQPEPYKSWLRYAYDEDCPASIKLDVFNALYNAWIDLPERSRRVNREAFDLQRYADLAMIAMVEMRHMLANGRKRFMDVEKCVNIGLPERESKHWARSWMPHENDMLSIMDLWDKRGKAPVSKVLNNLIERNCTIIQ